MLHVLISLFGMPRRVKRMLVFLKFCRFDPGSSIKLIKAKIPIIYFMCCDVTVTLFSFDFVSNFVESLLATYYVACSFFFA